MIRNPSERQLRAAAAAFEREVSVRMRVYTRPATTVPLTARERAQQGQQRRLALEEIERLRKVVAETRPTPKPVRSPVRSSRTKSSRTFAGSGLSDESVEELAQWYADEWGVPEDVAEDILEATGPPPLIPIIDDLEGYIDDLAELLDIDISDLWDMYYGYTPTGEA